MITWRYINRGSVKHALYGSPRAGSWTPARCGTSPAWHDPKGWRGAGPTEGPLLDNLQPCQRCVAGLEKDT